MTRVELLVEDLACINENGTIDRGGGSSKVGRAKS